jgi:hypothetical protein
LAHVGQLLAEPLRREHGHRLQGFLSRRPPGSITLPALGVEEGTRPAFDGQLDRFFVSVKPARFSSKPYDFKRVAGGSQGHPQKCIFNLKAS